MMAAGLFLMGTPGFAFFSLGLVLLILGNGFFKPNISVMVGNLYEPGDPKRDAGFNIFYMGINIGAFVANLLAAGVRNQLGWLWTFRAAGLGLLFGIVILIMNWKTLAAADRQPETSPEDTTFGMIFGKILLPAFGIGGLGYFIATRYLPDLPLRPAVFGFLTGMIPVLVFFVRMGLNAKDEEKPGLLALLPVYVAGGTFFMILHLNGSAMTQWARDNTDRQAKLVPAAMKQEALPQYYLNAKESTPRPDPRSLVAVPEETTALMFGTQRLNEDAVQQILDSDGTLSLVLITETSNETLKRRSSNVFQNQDVTVKKEKDSHGVETTAVTVPDKAKPIRQVAFVRQVDGKEIPVTVVSQATFTKLYDGFREKYKKDPLLLPPGEYLPVANSELYQSFNPLFVIAFTPLVVAFFQYFASRKKAITTAKKLLIGLLLTTASLLLMALAGLLSQNGTVKVGAIWLIGFYAIVTIGELCLSPMGLSLVTKLSPKRLVGLTMGGWFMATAFGNNFSGFFGGIQGSMSPVNFFLLLSVLAGLASLFIFLLLPKLDKAIKQYGG